MPNVWEIHSNGVPKSGSVYLQQAEQELADLMTSCISGFGQKPNFI
jgi:hypothetical protein